MFFISDWYIIPAAVLLDFILGDKEFIPHPIRLMGKASDYFEQVFRKKIKDEFISGFLFAVFLIISAFILTLFLLKIVSALSPVAGTIVEIVVLYYSISIKSLKDAAIGVEKSLVNSGIQKAKEKLKLIVGREVENLDKDDMARATIETIAENFVDGVLSPLFFAGIGGAPLAFMYKMINTLDSMVGYRNEKYENFGKTAARIDDIANFIPARLSVLIIALTNYILNKDYKCVLKTAAEDGKKHTSPNSGYPEASFAGALGVRLGGANTYNGKIVDKPVIGEKFRKSSFDDISDACKLMVYSSGVAAFTGMSIAHIMSFF